VESSPTFRVFQAGDPTSKKLKPEQLRGKSTEQVATEFELGIRGSGTTVPLEARLPNAANSLGLARSADPNSGDSQFYVNLSDNHSLDGGYCVFGRILSGQDVAASVQIGDRIHSFAME
jgi:cyclophilin family peptidyl-prolyl cis-trans isomerase